MESNGKATLFLLPFMFNFIMLGMIPLFIGIISSFFKFDAQNLKNIEFVWLKNYVLIFQSNVYSKLFWEAMRTTVIFTVIVLPLRIIIPLGLAFLLSFKPKGYKVFQGILYFPTVVSVSIVGILFVGIFSDGPSSLFNAIFGTNIQWLSNETMRWVVIILANLWNGVGSNAIILLAAINNVPKSLGEACEADGGNWWTKFTTVLLPNIKGSIEIVIFTSIISSLNLYGLPLVITTDIYADQMESPMRLIQYLLEKHSYLSGFVTAFSIVFGVLVGAVTVIQRKVMKPKKGGNKYAKRYVEYKKTQEMA